MSGRTIPKQSSRFDERRNTSRVFQPLPNAVPEALQALAWFRSKSQAHARWIEDGAPTMTEREHVQRFGVAYKRS